MKLTALFADRDVDLAATLMRMLFIKDLRRPQDSIDDAIVDVQVRTPIVLPLWSDASFNHPDLVFTSFT